MIRRIDHFEIQMRVHNFFFLEIPTPEVEGLKALTNQLRCWSCHLSFLTRAEIYQIFLFILAEVISHCFSIRSTPKGPRGVKRCARVH